ncbi:ABC transporter ATP-binding protein [Rhizohabitans arisaemae]|uniref:ABC transporter ATP-binding protein n=1 Tax=Rhizohabitans arisaemae TaxID=2720610 RepID=UPI0024B03B5F|nr:ABC transporter ATP-binding protein [Rhizohabitans arisaemae]
MPPPDQTGVPEPGRLITGVARRGGPWLAILAVTALTGAVADLALPHLLGRTVDTLVTGGAAGPVLWACVAVVALIVVCDVLGILAGGAGGARATAWLRHRTVRHILDTGVASTRRFTHGDLLTRTGVNAEEVGRAPEAVINAATLVIPAAGSLVVLTLVDPWLSLTLAVGLVLIAVVLRAFFHETTGVAADYQQAQGDISARLLDALTGARTIAAAGTAAEETRRVLVPLPRLREAGLRLWRVHANAGVQAAVVVPFLEIAVLSVGGVRLAQGALTVGELLAAARYVVLGAGIASALGYVGRVARARAAARRVAGLFELPAVPYGDGFLPGGPGRLELRGVGVRLDGRDILADVDLTVPGGSCVAVVGAVGAGKSTLAAVAGRLLDPDTGTVLLDGIPLRRLSADELRGAVGYAFELPVLLGATVADAVGFGARVPGEERIRAAAREAGADGFIRRLPHGYATAIAQAPMSGGEAQRIGLARAFARDGRLLVLDDATSSLDTVTERQVTAALTERLGDRTRLIVTHRVATAARSDRVVWLQDGRVRAYASHQVLWENPEYRAVFQTALPDSGGTP